MNKPLTVLAASAFVFLSACSNEPQPQRSDEPTPAQPGSPEQPERTGTSIRIGDEGVQIDSKGTNVSISSDSAAVEIK